MAASPFEQARISELSWVSLGSDPDSPKSTVLGSPGVTRTSRSASVANSCRMRSVCKALSLPGYCLSHFGPPVSNICPIFAQ